MCRQDPQSADSQSVFQMTAHCAPSIEKNVIRQVGKMGRGEKVIGFFKCSCLLAKTQPPAPARADTFVMPVKVWSKPTSFWESLPINTFSIVIAEECAEHTKHTTTLFLGRFQYDRWSMPVNKPSVG